MSMLRILSANYLVLFALNMYMYILIFYAQKYAKKFSVALDFFGFLNFASHNFFYFLFFICKPFFSFKQICCHTILLSHTHIFVFIYIYL